MLTLIEKNQAEKALDFSAIDSNGNSLALSNFYEKKNIVLVLNRGCFCPYCQKHMKLLRDDFQKFTEMDTEIIAVGPEGTDEFSKFWTENNIPFTGIPDPTHELSQSYGQQVKILKVGRMPALFIIDKDGLIRARHFATSMSEIPGNDELFSLLETINGEA